MSLAITSPKPGNVFNSATVAVFTLIGALGGGFFCALRATLHNTSSARTAAVRDATRHAKRIFTAYDGFILDARSQPKPGSTKSSKTEDAPKQPLPSSEDLLG